MALILTSINTLLSKWTSVPTFAYRYPQGQQAPYNVFVITQNVPEYSKDGTTKDLTTFSILFFDEDVTEAEARAERVRQGLENIEGFWCTDTDSIYNDENNTMAYILTFTGFFPNDTLIKDYVRQVRTQGGKVEAVECLVKKSF